MVIWNKFGYFLVKMDSYTSQSKISLCNSNRHYTYPDKSTTWFGLHHVSEKFTQKCRSRVCLEKKRCGNIGLVLTHNNNWLQLSRNCLLWRGWALVIYCNPHHSLFKLSRPHPIKVICLIRVGVQIWEP